MRKGRGKGKISNDLVVASCAIVLAVYAAGYSRTRDAARRFESHAKERRQALPTAALTGSSPVTSEPAARVPGPDGIEAPAPGARLASNPAVPAPVRSPASQASAAKVKRTPAASSPGALKEITPVPLPADDAVAKPIAIARDSGSVATATWRDGTYTGLGESPHGDIEARVVIKQGRIVEAAIATCATLYPCDVIEPLINQPVARQSPDVDYMSHATESSDAWYEAVVAALTAATLEQPAGSTGSSK